MDQAVASAIDVTKHYISSLNQIANWRGYGLEEYSYSQVAAYEILGLLSEAKDTPPLDIIEEFKEKMAKYSKMNKSKSDGFAVGFTTAECIIEVLCS